MHDVAIVLTANPYLVVENFAEELDESEVMEVILHLDHMVADTGFTEKLTKKLKKSLKNENRW
jgi:hypothetical protein